MNKIVAIVGMCGSGKSVATNYFENEGFSKVYFGGVTMNKLKELNLEVNPTNEKMVREDLRKKHGMGAYAFLLLDEIKEKLKVSNVVLDGLYSWDEYKILSEEFSNEIVLLAIIANKETRYERLTKREIRPLSKEDAVKRDISELETLKKGGPIAYADYFITNDSNIDDLTKNLIKFRKENINEC